MSRRARLAAAIAVGLFGSGLLLPVSGASANGDESLWPNGAPSSAEGGATQGKSQGFAAMSVRSSVIAGTIKGPQIGIPSGSGWAANSDYGSLPNGGTLQDNIASMQDIEDTARANGVKWADADNPSDRYNVYHIYGVRPNGSTGVWKYGITKEPAGTYRPTSQLTQCRDFMRREYNDSSPDCRWLWIRNYTSNFMRARRVEAAYFTEYKLRTGNCPPGATSCF